MTTRSIVRKMLNQLVRSWRWLRYYYWRLVRLHDSPEFVARGIAVGVFAGCFPLFGLQILIGVFLAAPVRGHKLAAAAGTWISNPLTYLPMYWFNFEVGRFLRGASRDIPLTEWNSIDNILTQTNDVLLDLFIGCVAVGTVCSVASYYLTLRSIRLWKQRRQQRRRRISAT